MTDKLGDEMTGTTPLGKGALDTPGNEPEIDEGVRRRFGDRVFWGNVLAGVAASFVFFLLTKIWELLVDVAKQLSAGFTALSIGALTAFVVLLIINVVQTARHTKDPKAMGTPAFLIWQGILGLVGASLVVLLLSGAIQA